MGVSGRAAVATAPIGSHWADRWTLADRALVKIKPDDPAGQARLEALALLVSLATWQPILAASEGSLTIIGDALGVLHDAIKFKGREPTPNPIMGEIALIMAPMDIDTRAANVWSQRNSICDEFCRLQCQDNPTHAALTHAQRIKRRPTPDKLLSTS